MSLCIKAEENPFSLAQASRIIHSTSSCTHYPMSAARRKSMLFGTLFWKNSWISFPSVFLCHKLFLSSSEILGENESIKASLSNVNLIKKRLGNSFCSLERGCIILRCPLLCQKLKMLHEPHLGKDEQDPPFERLRPVEHPFHHYNIQYIGASRINHLFPQVEFPFVKTLEKLNFSKYTLDGTEGFFFFYFLWNPVHRSKPPSLNLKTRGSKGFNSEKERCIGLEILWRSCILLTAGEICETHYLPVQHFKEIPDYIKFSFGINVWD